MILPFYWLCHAVVRVIAKVWLRRRRVDAHHVPRRGRVLLVANHVSFLDPPLVGTAVNRTVHFLARQTLRDVPVWGQMMAWVGTMFVDLGGSPRRGLQLAIDQLELDEAVCLFPEGSRSRDGSVGAFARGMELVLRRTAAPVVPVGIRGAFESMGRGRNWPRPVRVELHFGAPMAAAEVLADGGMAELRRRVCTLAGRPEDADRDYAADASQPSRSTSDPASVAAPAGIDPGSPRAARSTGAHR